MRKCRVTGGRSPTVTVAWVRVAARNECVAATAPSAPEARPVAVAERLSLWGGPEAQPREWNSPPRVNAVATRGKQARRAVATRPASPFR